MKRKLLFSLLLLFSSAVLLAFVFDFKTPFYRYSPDRFESDIQQFEQQDQLVPPQLGGILLYGSSSIRGWKPSITQSFPNSDIVVRGFGGSMMHDLVFYFDRIVLPHQPKTLLIYAGENDVSAHVWQHTIVNRLNQLLEKVETQLPDTQVYFISIKPTPYHWSLRGEQIKVNQLVQSLTTQSSQLNYIDTSSAMLNQVGEPDPSLFQGDGIHMSAAGYQLWTNLIKPLLIQEQSP